ncbi:DUF4340 domain-containing protein [Mediterraneibacter glycyrrhizinilyticus]|uniref:DUF4340 domain-containing protein n=1 Tax=Mediterraneibacter glycyrrhizinilyticus TaxID=342942 RepID=UPI0025AB331E|nr:DUF4340 domain-containing protein [Mediterraneibacter glycyrrhizinilyticus]MDN0060473.1 DUF4340 domain-containing protein [Mediterraneibacter glycyrrhizinilyticus]
MKRQKRLIVLSGVLVVCVAGAVVISRIDFEEKMTGTETTIVDVDSADITKLSWNYEDEVSFTREDDEWKYGSDDKMAVDQELLDEIAENLSNITSDKMVEEVQSLGVYGLSEPQYNITVETEDETYEIAVGDETFSDGEVYISIGDDYVYLTDAGLIDDISYSLLDCVQKEEIPEMESISSVSVNNEDTLDIVYAEDSGYCYSDAYTYYLKDGESYQNLDNENTESMFTTMSEFAWEECVDYYAEDSELSSYGLDEPDAEVSIVYTPAEEEDDSENADSDEQTFSYEVGTADGAYYAKLTDSNIVYSISEDVYNAAVDAAYDELKPDEVVLLDWDTVDSVEIELDGNVYTVDIESNEDDEYTYTFGDSEIEFQDVLDQLSDITIPEESTEDDETSVPEEEPALSNNKTELSLTFHRNTEEYSTVEVVFYQYNGSYCIAALNGDELNYVDRSAVVNLKEAVNSVILDSTSGE